MLRVVFQDVARRDNFEHFIKGDVLFDHLLLSVLSKTNILFRRQSAYVIEHCLEISNIGLIHPTSPSASRASCG